MNVINTRDKALKACFVFISILVIVFSNVNFSSLYIISFVVNLQCKKSSQSHVPKLNQKMPDTRIRINKEFLD